MIFHPYSPGNTPGISHAFEEDDGDDDEGRPGSSSSISGKHSSQDFKRTSPGHSPGDNYFLILPTVHSRIMIGQAEDKVAEASGGGCSVTLSKQ
ncbi:hypothetical protein F3Y22_tig00110788pilonHSYRG00313 [Hibiscus syriacus]|uniref:Uncharacterized protein n=1 Tax=Hibiscus syriacus TaxID=106335 RepID=A0A6A2ZQ77_HIBSY|nr:hypothetical protein F3Y22_tig00110788pilonHSYRG00313 [Hibiscus syriacus]